jgi:hypothetical protein
MLTAPKIEVHVGREPLTEGLHEFRGLACCDLLIVLVAVEVESPEEFDEGFRLETNQPQFQGSRSSLVKHADAALTGGPSTPSPRPAGRNQTRTVPKRC